MKKILFAAAALLSLVGLHSCLGDNGSVQHGTSIFTPNNTMFLEMYADQTLDSLGVFTYDDWEASLQWDKYTPWFVITPQKGGVPKGYVSSTTIMYVKAEPNTTGMGRGGAVVLDTDNPDNNSKIGMTVWQYGWLRITVPTPTYSSQKLEEAVATFKMDLLPESMTASMAFYNYGMATLTSDADWFIVPDDIKSLEPGAHGVKFSLLPNTTGVDRVAHVTLTSNGVSNVVTYTQKGKK